MSLDFLVRLGAIFGYLWAGKSFAAGRQVQFIASAVLASFCMAIHDYWLVKRAREEK